MKRRTFARLLVLAAVAVVAAWWLFRRPPVHSIRHVVLVSIDTCRADHLSCYGYGEPTTPHIDAVARDGVRFKNTIAPVPMTLASHSTMLTGTNPPHHGVHDNFDFRLGPSNRTLAEILKEQGFTTAAFVSTFVLDAQFGLDQGFDTYDDEVDASAAGAHGDERKAQDTTKAALAWLDQHTRDPFFLFLHYYDPHLDYEPPEPFRSKFAEPYAGEIAYADHALGQVMDRLKALGLYESTLIVITSDHGEMLGEHGERTHTYYIYQSAVRVPLIFKLPAGVEMRGPDVKPQLVGTVDIVPTVCGLLGIEAPQPVAGEDLTDVLLGRSAGSGQRRLYSESFTPLRYGANSLLGLVGERWKLIETTRPELYDLRADPGESKNVAVERPDQLRELQGRLGQLLHDQVRDDPDSTNRTDAESIRRLEAIGYAQGELEKAIGHFQEAARISPESFQARSRLARALAAGGRAADAIGHFQAAAVLRRDDPDVRFYLAKALVMSGRSAEALRPLTEATQLNPDWPSALNARAWILATHADAKVRDPQQALRLAQRAAELTQRRDAATLDTLAAAQAAAGNHAVAAETAREAIELATSASAGELAEEIRTRLKVYEAERSYVEGG